MPKDGLIIEKIEFVTYKSNMTLLLRMYKISRNIFKVALYGQLVLGLQRVEVALAKYHK